MKNVAEMQAKLEGLKADASAILDKVEADGRTELNDEEHGALDAVKADIAETKKSIAAAEKLAELRREMAATTARPALSTQVRDPNPETTGGFKSLGEFATVVRNFVVNGENDRRLMAAPTNVHQGDGASGEGFLIPSEYRNDIWNAISETDDLLSRFSITPTGARSVEMIRDETTPWGASGIQAYWRAEGSQMTPTKMLTKASRVELHDLYALAAVTEETLSDAPRLNSQLTMKAAQAIAWKAGEALMFGTGVGQPLGFMNSTALVSVAKEGSQAADTIVAGNINKMYARLLAIPGDRPFWLTNRDTFPQYQAMTTGDSPIFYPPGGITTAPNGTLLGYPIVYTEHAKTLGDKGDIVLVSPGGYFATVRGGGVQFAASMHLWFDYNTSAFRWTFRMGGQPILSAAVSPAKGSATKSHFVTVDERA